MMIDLQGKYSINASLMVHRGMAVDAKSNGIGQRACLFRILDQGRREDNDTYNKAVFMGVCFWPAFFPKRVQGLGDGMPKSGIKLKISVHSRPVFPRIYPINAF